MPHKRAKRSVREQNRIQNGPDRAPGNDASRLENEGIPKSMSRVLNAASIRQEYHGKRKRQINGDAEDGESSTKKKRKGGDTVSKHKNGDAKGKTRGKDLKGAMKGILPGESLLHFNRRVEEDMRPLIRSAMQSSAMHARKTIKDEADAKMKAKTSSTSTAKSKTPEKTKPLNPPSSAPDSDDATPTAALKKGLHVHKGRARKSEFDAASTSAPKRLNDIALAPPTLSALPRGVKSSAASGTAAGSSISSKSAAILTPIQRAQLEAERDGAIARYRAMKEARTGVGRFPAGAVSSTTDV